MQVGRVVSAQSVQCAVDSGRSQERHEPHFASHKPMDAKELRGLLFKCQKHAAALRSCDGSAKCRHELSSAISDCTSAPDSDSELGIVSSQESSDDDSATITTCVSAIDASPWHKGSALSRLRANGDAVLSFMSESRSYPSAGMAGLAPALASTTLPFFPAEHTWEAATSHGSDFSTELSGPRSLTCGVAIVNTGSRSGASWELPLRVMLADMPSRAATRTQQPMYVSRFSAFTAPPGL